MKPGFHSIPAAEYHADPCDEPSLSSSIANVLLNRLPLHAWHAHPRLNPAWRPIEPTNEMDAGTAAHMLLLEGHTNRVVIVDAKDWRTDAAKEARVDARVAGKTPILRKHFFGIKAMVDAAKEQVTDGMLAGEAEQVIVWQENGIWCRAMMDLYHPVRILDYKTTDNAEPNGFCRRIGQMGYDVQEAFYRRGVKVLTGEDVSFVFLVQEIDPPYLLSCVALDRDWQELADRKVQRAIDTWARCMETKHWPGYPTEICYAQAPGWAASQWEEQEVIRESRTDLGGQA